MLKKLLARLRGLGRVLAWGMVGLLGMAVAVFLAWLPFNVGDADPRPMPPELQRPAARVPDDRNAAYTIEGLLAEAGRDPAATGRATWAQHTAWFAKPRAERAEATDPRAVKLAELTGRMIVPPRGPPWVCSNRRDHCEAEWLARADDLSRQRAAFAEVGARCERLVDGAFEFEELLPPAPTPEAPLMQWSPATHCGRWFRSSAVQALAAGRRDEALAQLKRADRWGRQLMAGSRTLVGHMVSMRVERAVYDALAAAAIREPALAEAIQPLVATPMDTRAGARTWMVLEANFQREMIDELRGLGGSALGVELGSGPLTAFGDWLSRHGIGLQAERTKQKLDEAWRQRVARMQAPWPEILARPAVVAASQASAPAAAAAPPAGSEGGFRWRNTFGEALIDLADGTNYESYLARHADHDLHREAAALVIGLQRQRVPAAQRAEAAGRAEGLSPVLKSRMTWSADGRTLTVRPWQAGLPGYDRNRDDIVFGWPQ